jgi:hypothetical protein
MFRLRTLGLALAVVASLILVRVVPSTLLRSRLTEAFVEAAGKGDTTTVQALHIALVQLLRKAGAKE